MTGEHTGKSPAPRSRWIAIALAGLVLLAIVPIILTWNAPEPTSSPDPSPSSSAPEQPIVVAELGHTLVDERHLGYGVILRNRTGQVGKTTVVQFTALDASGTPIPGAAWTRSAGRVPANGDAAVSGVFLDETTSIGLASVADVRVEVGHTTDWSPDRPETDAALAALTPSAITVTEKDGPSVVDLDFRLPVAEEVAHLRFNALFRDTDGRIVGGCADDRVMYEARPGGRVRLKGCARPTNTTATEIYLEPVDDGSPLPTPEKS